MDCKATFLFFDGEIIFSIRQNLEPLVCSGKHPLLKNCAALIEASLCCTGHVKRTCLDCAKYCQTQCSRGFHPGPGRLILWYLISYLYYKFLCTSWSILKCWHAVFSCIVRCTRCSMVHDICPSFPAALRPIVLNDLQRTRESLKWPLRSRSETVGHRNQQHIEGTQKNVMYKLSISQTQLGQVKMMFQNWWDNTIPIYFFLKKV